MSFFFNDTATTEIYTLSLHDALPIWAVGAEVPRPPPGVGGADRDHPPGVRRHPQRPGTRGEVGEHRPRSEEHTSELQSRQYLVCRLLLEKKTTHAAVALRLRASTEHV